MAETLRAVTIDQISDKELASHIISNTGLFPMGFVAVFISSIGEIYSSHAAITVSNSNVSSTVRVGAKFRTAFAGVKYMSEFQPEGKLQHLLAFQCLPVLTYQSHGRQ